MSLSGKGWPGISGIQRVTDTNTYGGYNEIKLQGLVEGKVGAEYECEVSSGVFLGALHSSGCFFIPVKYASSHAQAYTHAHSLKICLLQFYFNSAPSCWKVMYHSEVLCLSAFKYKQSCITSN